MLKIEGVEIRNFRSHADTKIEFDDGINVILGRNGAGKTSILEAILVALYGARAARVRKGDLIRSGAAKFSITLRFRLKDKEYVIRRSSDGETVLTGDLKLEGDSRVSEWVERHVAPLHVFQNAIYVRQGEIEAIVTDDESRERVIKKVTRIEDYESAWRVLGTIIELFRREGEGYRRLASQEEEVRDQLERKRRELEDAKRSIEELRSGIDSMRRRLDELERAKARMDTLRGRIEEIERKKGKTELQLSSAAKELEALRQSLSDLEERARELERMVEVARKLESDAARYQRLERMLKSAENALQNLVRERAKLESRRGELMRRMREEEEKIRRAENVRREIEKIESRLAALQPGVETWKDIEVKLARIEQLRKRIEGVGEDRIRELRNELDRAREEEERLKETATKIVAKKSSLKTRGLQLKRAYDELKRATGSCPTCGRELSDDMRRRLLKDYAEELKKIKEELEDLSRLEKKIGEKIERIRSVRSRENEIVQLANTLEELKRLEDEISGCNVAELKTAATEFDELRRRRERLEGMLRELESVDVEGVREELRRVESRLAELDAAEANIIEKLREEGFESLDALRRSVEELKDRFLEWYELKSSERELEDVRRRIAETRARIGEMEEIVERLKSELEKIERELEELKESYSEEEYAKLDGELRRVSAELRGAEEKLKALEDISGRLEEDIEHLERQLSRIKEYAKKADVIERRVIPELTRIRERLRKYKNLVAEAAMKEVERIASRIFEELTDGKYSGVRLRRAFEKKEKLKLFVVYQGDEKDVSFLSGGELIALALAFRLALTMFLVRGKVPILMLDEPTPFLDEDRRRRLVEIVANYLRRIPQVIIVTHDDELKDAADRVIRVDFSAGASRVSHVEA